LEEGGTSKAVTFQNRIDYVKKVVKARISESAEQCEAIRRGIMQIVPEALLNLASKKEIEEWIFGKKFIDVDLLKRHTIYGFD
jgi:hypothetical protein